MKHEEKLVNTDNQFELNFAPPQQKDNLENEEEKENYLYTKKNFKKLLFISLIILILGFSAYLENKEYNITSLLKTIKQYLGIKEHIDKLCYELDPFHIFELRLNNPPVKICENEITNQNHICYLDTYKDYIFVKNGVTCTMKNIIVDPSKSIQSNIIYKGPVDPYNRGFPILTNGFLNMNCKNKKEFEGYYILYGTYFNSWNYNYNNEEELQEIAPGKTIFFMNRNQDSPNIYHGSCELINAVVMMKLLKLKPEDIQVIFLESMTINDDPFYDLYKEIISRGGDPIHIRNITKKFFVSSAVNIPINTDSPAFLDKHFLECGEHEGKAYKLLNDLINKYMNIPSYEDRFISDNEIYYYPKSVLDEREKEKEKIKYKKYITIQWRKVWPKGRTGQYRILGNGPQLAEKLANVLPKDFLVRLVDTAGLTIREQISLMKKTDYLVGMHGAGLSLSIFMSNKSILHEVLPHMDMTVLTFMSSISGHKTYSDILRATKKYIEGSEYFFFKEGHFVRKVLIHMKENNYFKKY